MRIRKQIVPLHRRRRYLGRNKKLWITVHETGNRSRGADAAAHGNYLAGPNRPMSNSWHYSVDENEAVQSYEDIKQCWHSGMGRDHGNLNSVAIEICVNSDGDWLGAVENAAALVRILMERHNIPLSRVVQHNYWSGKNCPQQIRRGEGGITWSKFLEMVVAGTPASAPAPTPSKPKPAPKPAAPAKPKESIVSELPRIDLSNADRVTVVSEDVGRWQALLLAAGYGPQGLVGRDGRPDKRGGSATKSFSGQLQVRHNAGDGRGNPDYIIYTKSWRAGLGL